MINTDDHAYFIGNKRKATNPDYQVLRREAKAINATIDWDSHRSHIDITIYAPSGFAWANSGETTLCAQAAKNHTRDTVQELLQAMKQGFKRKSNTRQKHEDDCECEDCEGYDEEISELDF